MFLVVRDTENVQGIDDGSTLHRRPACDGVVPSRVSSGVPPGRFRDV
ncbi:MAG TPA: hypothetical protein VJN18_00190 [Polyangiaceae bacterium]|nr:hypothetical protein [Polyangiaceae bacterium]